MNQPTRPADLPEIIGGRYRVLDEIGHGGMGRVLRVEHLHTGEILAMKVLLAARTGESQTLDRFRREARSLAQVRGDHVVRVIDADIAPELDGTPYLVMELLEGEDLAGCLRRRGKLTPAEVAGLVHQLALGLARVHKAGLVHRDLKPGNIFLCQQDGRVTLKLLDFGLVKSAFGVDDDSVTVTGAAVGTPLFMSPEQIHGRTDAVGPAADIWAVGIVTFYLLTGRRYWEPAQLPRGILDIGSGPLEAPSTRDSSLTVAFDSWFLRSCALNPAARWPDPLTQARELAAILGYPAAELPSVESREAADGRDSATVTLAASGARDSGASGSAARERRQVTVLFYRLTHKGPGDAEIDPEDFEAREMRLHGALDEAFGDLSRTSTRLAQGGRFVFFGYPLAYGHDARRAVQAALRLISLVRSLDSQAAEAGTGGLAVRVGIHTGMVLAGRSAEGGPGVSGPAPGVATDLEHAAAPGQILVSEATWQMLGGHFRGQAAGDGNFAVSGEADESQSVSSSAAAMIGREVELGLLLSCLEGAEGGESQMVHISGEGGIGKSRLLQAMREHAGTSAMAWIECGCSPYFQGTPFRPLIELVQGLIAKETGPDPDEEARQLFEFLLGLPGSEASQVQRLSPALRRERTIHALIAALDRRAEAHPPLIVAVEDLHWADPSTLEFLDRLSMPRNVPLLTLLTSRPDFSPAWSSPSAVTPLQLRRLSQAQAAQLIARTAPRELPTRVAELVARTTGGIPLFIEELTRLMANSPDSAADSSGGLGPVPATLRGALNARLDRLGPARMLAERAAVIGGEFKVEDLRVLAGDGAVFDAGLRELVRSKVIQARGMPPPRSYAFQHALLRDAAYDLLPLPTRRELHSRLARAMAGRADVEREVLAHHFAEGGMLLEAAGCLLQAGQAALERSANAEARDYFQRGIELLQRNKTVNPELTLAGTPLEITLWTLKGMAWVVSRGYAVPGAEASIAAAMELVQGLQRDETPDLAPALWAHWIFMLVRGRFVEAEAQGRRLLRLAERCGDSGIDMLAHLALGITLHGVGRFEEAVRHLNQGLERYDPAGHASYRFMFGQDPWMLGSVFKAWALWCLGFPDRAAELVTQAVAHAERLRHPNSLGFSLALSAIIHHYRGDVEATARASKALLDLSGEQGWIQWLGHAKLWNGAVQVLEGKMEEGLAEMREARKLAEQAGEVSGSTHYDTVVIDALLRAKKLDEAAEWIARTKQVVVDSGETAFAADLLRVQGELARARGDRAAARNWFEAALRSAASTGSLSYQLRAATSLARMEREQGTGYDEARARLLAILAKFEEGFETADVKAAFALARETVGRDSIA